MDVDNNKDSLNTASLPGALQIARNAIVGSSSLAQILPGESRDVNLLFNMIILQDRTSGSLKKLPVFLYIVNRICISLLKENEMDRNTNTGELLHLKQEVTNRLTQQIVQKQNFFFSRVCNILSNFLEIAQDESALLDTISLDQGSKTTEVNIDMIAGSYSIGQTLCTRMLRFVYLLLTECLASLIDHVCSLNTADLACAYMRLSDFCVLWRISCISYVSWYTDSDSELDRSGQNGHLGKSFCCHNYF